MTRYSITANDLMLLCIFLTVVGFMFGALIGNLLGSDDSKKKHTQDEFKRIFGFESDTYDRAKHYDEMKERLLFLKSSAQFFELNRAIEAAVNCEHSEVVSEVLAGIQNPEVTEKPTL